MRSRKVHVWENAFFHPYIVVGFLAARAVPTTTTSRRDIGKAGTGNTTQHTHIPEKPLRRYARVVGRAAMAFSLIHHHTCCVRIVAVSELPTEAFSGLRTPATSTRDLRERVKSQSPKNHDLQPLAGPVRCAINHYILHGISIGQ